MSGYADLGTNFENTRNCLRRIARHDEQEFSKDSIVNVMEKFVKTVNAMDETILVPCRLMDRQVGDSTDLVPTPPKTSLHHHHHHHSHHNNTTGGSRRKGRAGAPVHEALNSADLFNIYNMLNSIKNDLLWTRNDGDDSNDDDSVDKLKHSMTSASLMDPDLLRLTSTESTDSVQSQQQQQPQRQQSQQSTKSTISSNSTTSTRSSRPESGKGHIRRPSTASMASSNSASNLSDSESEISNENDSGIESEGNSCTNVDKATDLARQCRTHLNGLYRCLEQMTEAANYLTARYQSDIGPV